MKKYLYSALALPLLFACSSEDFNEQVVSNDQFAGIEKVDATFTMDEPTTRFDGAEDGIATWLPQNGDLWGFAWLGDGTKINPATAGIAYQNHNLIQKGSYFEPQTSIYVGKYFIYRPYDEETVSPQAINFKSLENQPLAEGYESAKQPWRDLAKTAINIGDKWTNVTTTGTTDLSGKTWDKAGIKQSYMLYAALFSNQTGLDLTYKKNNPTFTAAKRIQGATDIDHTYAAGTAVGAADIYNVTVGLTGAAKSFTYAPKAEPNSGAHSGSYWADKDGTAEVVAGKGFDFSAGAGAITLTPEDAVNGLSTGVDGSKAWFWFNSLPVTAGTGALSTNVQTVFTTSYGIVTVTKTVGQCASVFDKYAGTGSNEWIKLDAADNATSSPKKWQLDGGTHNTFINQYGNHKGKYTFDVDFSTGLMDGMDIKSDTHLQKLLKYYIASGKTETPVVLNLQPASATDNTFKISKISIALLQTINAGGKDVRVDAAGLDKVIVTQDGQAELGLADKKEVPDLNNVFVNTATDVALSKDCDWTWKERSGANQLTIDAQVKSLTNEGTLTVNATNIQLSVAKPLANAAGATMNITQVTTVKTALTNNGTINVGAADNTAAELRAYGVEVKNNATSLTLYGTINNYGVVGKSAGTVGQVNNYGHINMTDANAITLLTSNEVSSAVLPKGPFSKAFAAGTNMMGTVVLPNSNPYALVSVSNGDETGFIKYTWTGATYSHDAGNVKYNTIVVSNNITFTGGAATEIKFIEFDGTRTQVVNPSSSDKLPNLKGIIVNAGKSIILEKTNVLDCLDGAYLGNKATIYRGGDFLCNGSDFAVAQTTNYLGTWSLDQIVEW